VVTPLPQGQGVSELTKTLNRAVAQKFLYYELNTPTACEASLDEVLEIQQRAPT